VPLISTSSVGASARPMVTAAVRSRPAVSGPAFAVFELSDPAAVRPSRMANWFRVVGTVSTVRRVQVAPRRRPPSGPRVHTRRELRDLRPSGPGTDHQAARRGGMTDRAEIPDVAAGRAVGVGGDPPAAAPPDDGEELLALHRGPTGGELVFEVDVGQPGRRAERRPPLGRQRRAACHLITPRRRVQRPNPVEHGGLRGPEPFRHRIADGSSAASQAARSPCRIAFARPSSNPPIAAAGWAGTWLPEFAPLRSLGLAPATGSRAAELCSAVPPRTTPPQQAGQAGSSG